MENFIFTVMKRTITITILFLSFLTAFGQNGTPPIAGARGLAMGRASVCFTDINSAFSNQAGLAYLKTMQVSVSAENRFLTNSINSFSAAAAYPTNSGTFGLTMNYFGFSAYNEQKIGLSYSRLLFEKLAIGAQFDYLNTSVTDYGNKAVFSFEAGIYAQILKQVALGVHVFSPARIEVAAGEYLPTIMSFGLNYTPSKKLLLTAELEKDIDFPVVVKAGIEYNILDALHLRFGGATNPTLASLGVGYFIKNTLKIDAGVAFHQILGLTPAVTIAWHRKAKK